MLHPASTPAGFIDHWSKAEANERANSQSFLTGLTQLLDLPKSSGTKAKAPAAKKPGTKVSCRTHPRHRTSPACRRPPRHRRRTHPQFSRARAADLQEILESLVTLGRERKDGERFGV